MLLFDLCITPPFARFLRQARISILEILHSIPVVEIFAFLELEQNWMFFKGLLLNILKGTRIRGFKGSRGKLNRTGIIFTRTLEPLTP
jgi:hypothetical protein